MPRWAGLALAMVYPTILSWVYFIALAEHRKHGGPSAPAAATRNPTVVAAYAGGKLIQFALPLWWVWRVERRRVRLALPGGKGLGAGLAFGLVVGAAAYVFYRLLRDHSQSLSGTGAQLHRKIDDFGIGTPAAYIGFAVFLCVVHSLLEEYYWRWFLFRALDERLGLGLGILLSSLAFMAHHVVILGVFFPGRFWEMAVPLSVGVGIGGAFWAWLYHRSGSLYASWLSHLVVDGAILAVGYEMLFG